MTWRREAGLGALADAGVSMAQMQVMACGNLFNRTPALGQQVQKQIGQTGIPVYNVTNACATGATAVRSVMLAIKAGEADLGLAVGVEKMGKMGLLGRRQPQGIWRRLAPRGPLRRGRAARGPPRHGDHAGRVRAGRHGVRAHLRRHDAELFAKIAEKNHAHSTLNPLADYQKRFSLEEIIGDVMISYPNTLPMCSANTDGAAAAVLVSEAKLRTLDPEQRRRAVKISASVLTTDPWEEGCQVLPDVNTLTRNAAKTAYDAGGRRARGPRTWWSCTTASPPPSWCTTTT